MLIPAQSQPQSCDLGQTLQLDLSFAMHTMLSWLCYSGILSCRIGLLKAVWAFPGKCGWLFICLFGLWFLLLFLICLPCYYQCSPYLMQLETQDTFLISQISRYLRKSWTQLSDFHFHFKFVLGIWCEWWPHHAARRGFLLKQWFSTGGDLSPSHLPPSGDI